MELEQFKKYTPNFMIAARTVCYFGGNEGFIFLIPEMWGNSFFLKNEYSIINDIKQKFNVQHFFCEGAFYAVSSAQMKTMLPKPQEEINRMFAAQQLKAQEYLALSSNEHLMVYGADEESLYNNQNAAYYAAREIFPTISPLFREVKEHLNHALNSKYDADTIKLYRDIVKRNAEPYFGKDLTDFAAILVNAAQKLKVTLTIDEKIEKLLFNSSKANKYQILTELQSIKLQLNAVFNTEDPDDLFLKRLLGWQAQNEKMQTNQILGLEYNQLFALYQRACENLKLLTENSVDQLEKDPLNIEAIELMLSLCSLAGIDESKHLVLFEYMHQRILLEKTIKGSYQIVNGYVDESMVEQLLNKIPDKGFLKKMFLFETGLNNLEQLFKTELLPEKAREIPFLMNKYNVDFIIEFLNDIGISESKTESLKEYSLLWDQTIARTKRFYECAFSRSQYMLEYCKDKLQKAGDPIGVLMVGGFHVQPIIRALQRDGRYSFLTLQCQIGTISSQGRDDYDRLMDTMNK